MAIPLLIKQIYYDPPSGEFVLRKYAHGTYQTINGAVIARTQLNGHDVITVEYSVKDGGPLDDDGVENGVIVDPAGLAIVKSVGVPNTGLRHDSMTSYIFALVVGAVVVVFSSAVARSKK